MNFTITSYDHGGVLLNVTGLRDEDETTIERITAADSAIDLFDIFTPTDIKRLAHQADIELDRRAARARYEAQLDNALRLMTG